MKKNKKAFTFVELIIVVTIIAILGTMGVISYTSNLSDARDSKRISDIGLIKAALKSYQQKRGSYPKSGNSFNIIYSGTTNIVSYQGKLNKTVLLSDLKKIPLDPKNKLNYTYSITKNKQEYQLAGTLENEDNPKALLVGDYKSVSKNILPTITLAIDANPGDNIEIQSGSTAGDENRKKFVFDNNYHNLVYSFEVPYLAYSDGTDFDTLLSEAETNNDFWQNSDYRNCIEIKEARKMIIEPNSTPFEYQIVDENGNLTNTGCTINNSQ